MENFSFLRHVSPLRVALIGASVYLLIFLLSPLRVDIDFSGWGIVYLLSGYAALACGCVAYEFIPKRKRRGQRTSVFHHPGMRLVGLVYSASLIGVVLKIYDRFFVRGISLFEDALSRREVIQAAGANIFSIFGGVLYPFCYLTLFVYLLISRDGERRPWLFVFSLILFFFPSIDALLLGSRVILMINLGLLVLYFMYFGLFKFRFRSVISLVLIAVFAMTLSSWIFMDRLSAMGLDVLVSIYESVYAFTVKPQPWLANALSSATSPMAYMALFTYLNLSQYLVHGVFEFCYLVDNFAYGINHTYGMSTFFVYFKLIAPFIGIGDVEADILSAQPRSGIYTTFFGPIFVDFGWHGLFLVFLFGFFATHLWNSAKRLGERYIPLYLYIVIVIFFIPFVNLIEGAQGLYTITAFLMYATAHWLIGPRPRRQAN